MFGYIFRYLEKEEPVKTAYVISMALYGSDPDHVMGAIRNAQTVGVFYPEWTLRFYIPHPSDSSPSLKVPLRILNNLARLGADIKIVNLNISHTDLGHLIADDLDVDYFIVKNIQHRFSRREAVLVESWVQGGDFPFVTIRDHPDHRQTPVIDDLYGGKPKDMKRILKSSVTDLLLKYRPIHPEQWYNIGTSSVDAGPMLNRRPVLPNSTPLPANETLVPIGLFSSTVLWPRLSKYALCYDTCALTDSLLMSYKRTDGEYIGQYHDRYHQPMDRDNSTDLNRCTKTVM